MAKKILVVEDDPVNLRLVRSRLETEGYDVDTAENGEVGLERVEENQPDLIILDVEMPKMNGYTFINRLTAMGIKIPIIVLTAHKDMQPIFSFKGAKKYLIKPIDFEELFTSMVECLG